MPYPVQPVGDPLSAAPPTTRRVRSLDGLRGVAVLLVFVSHAKVPGFALAGGVGVTIFFTLSGFLITSLLLGEMGRTGSVSLRSFYMRRALRLLPAVVVFVSMSVLMRTATLTDAAWVMAYAGNWARIGHQGLGALHHTWSLAIEEQFYLVWPVIFLLLARTRTPVRWILGVAALGSIGSTLQRCILWEGPSSMPRIHFGSDANANALLTGCGLAASFVLGHPRRIGRVAGTLAGAGLAILSGVLAWFPDLAGIDMYSETFTFTWAWPLTAVLTAVLLAHLRDRRWAWLEWPPLCGMGTLSYGFYLWHMPFVDYVLPSLGDIPRGIAVGTVFLLSLAASLVSYFVVERPFLLWKRRYERVHIEPSNIPAAA